MHSKRTLLLIALGLLALTLLASLAMAQREVLWDNFGVPGPPDGTKWEPGYSDWDQVYVVDGCLRTSSGQDWLISYVKSVHEYSCDNLSLRVEYFADCLDGTPLDIGIEMDDGMGRDKALNLYYDGQWNYRYFHDGSQKVNFTGKAGLKTGAWYTIELSIVGGSGSIRVTDTAASTTALSAAGIPIDPLKTHVFVNFGVRCRWETDRPSARWDTFSLVDPTAPPNVLPRWLQVPIQKANRGEATSIDFSSYVEDDQEAWELALSSPSPYLTSTSGLHAVLTFPQVTDSVYVPLAVSDGYGSCWTNVTFVVLHYNPPPEHDLPSYITVLEGVPETLDLRDHVWDRNDPLSNLTVRTNLPFVTVEGFFLVITAPEGSVRHDLRLSISDGENTVGALITIFVTSFDSPPQLQPLPSLVVEEDTAKTLDLMPYIKDLDTPTGDLEVGCDSLNCTFTGQVLRYLRTQGGGVEVVKIWVNDGTTVVTGDLTVHITPVDDPPIVTTIPVHRILEGETVSLSLDDYISDEDTPTERLVLQCDHPWLVGSWELNLTFLAHVSNSEEPIGFLVNDGTTAVPGTFLLTVIDVNDQPVILSIGGQAPPLNITVYATQTLNLEVAYEDEEGEACVLGLDAAPNYASLRGLMLSIRPGYDDVGICAVTVIVRDERLAWGSGMVVIEVLDPSEVPLKVEFLRPGDGLVMTEGDSVTLSVHVTHPVITHLGTITVTWTSDLQGLLWTTETTKDTPSHTRSSFLPGAHLITASVAAGRLYGEARVNITVNALPEARSEDPGYLFTMIVCVTLVVTGIVLAVAYAYNNRSSKARARTPGKVPTQGGPEPSQPALMGAPALGPRIEVARPMPMSDARLASMPPIPSRTADSWLRGKDVEMLEGQVMEARYTQEPVVRVQSASTTAPALEPVSQAFPVRPTAPAPLSTPASAPAPRPIVAPSPAQPTAVSRDAQRGGDMRSSILALKAVIDALPDGVPRDLSLYDSYTIAEKVLKGKTRTAPDGTPLVFVMGGWYVNTPDRPGTFLRPWRE